MSKVILDDETLAKLDRFARTAEVYNQAGELVGYCLPADTYARTVDLGGPDPFSDDEAAAAVRAAASAPESGKYAPFTDAEMAEALRDTGPGRPLADILADFRKL